MPAPCEGDRDSPDYSLFTADQQQQLRRIRQLAKAEPKGSSGTPELINAVMALGDHLSPTQQAALRGACCPLYHPEGNSQHAHWLLDSMQQGSFGVCLLCGVDVQLF
eukprot:GGOE01036720.1.p3 GENE.GGOE01036720.1~~GGOE01036720.1.p3  ORF type:complete len:107 (+),score=35.56 GGOE01036720.1:56-376(+)